MLATLPEDTVEMTGAHGKTVRGWCWKNDRGSAAAAAAAAARAGRKSPGRVPHIVKNCSHSLLMSYCFKEEGGPVREGSSFR